MSYINLVLKQEICKSRDFFKLSYVENCKNSQAAT